MAAMSILDENETLDSDQDSFNLKFELAPSPAKGRKASSSFDLPLTIEQVSKTR
jgi:hypothetical protein